MSPDIDETGSDQWPRFDVLDMSLAELVVRHDTSVRLQHAMLNFTGRSEVHTIRDYVEAGEVAGAILKRDIRSFGTKTADELDHLVKAAVQTWDPEAERFAGELATDDAAASDDGLERAFGSATLSEVIHADLVSYKLDRAIRESGIGARTFVSVARDIKAAQSELRAIRGVGKSAAMELRGFCESHLADPDRHIAGVAPAEGDGGLKAPLLDASDLTAVFVYGMGFLSEREVEVIQRRYGIARDEAETLEEVGKSYKITRERIRQIESKALKRLRIKLPGPVLAAALDARHGAVWDAFGSAFVLSDVLYVRRRTIDPLVHLALSVLDRRLEDWLDETSLRLEHGWYRDRTKEAQLAAIAERLHEVADSRPLPRPIGPLDAGLCEAAAKLVLGLHVEAGYLVLRRPGPRLSRAIWLHAILSRSGRSQSLVDLVAEYRTARPSDPCGERDAAIVIEAAPHLFVDVTDDRWLALGRGGDIPVDGDDGEVAVFSDAVAEQDATIYSTMVEVLRARGPSRFTDLRDAVATVLPANRSANSVAPTLVARRDTFVKILQGIYALHDQVPDEATVLNADVPFLMNEAQARLLAMARYAGERWGSFVLWTPSAEFRLCRWARFNAAGATYRSLLAVASIDEWPIPGDAQAEWERLAKRDASYTLQIPLSAVAHKLPDLDRVLACCIHVMEQGTLNWMSANRIDRGRINAGPGVALVAILVAADALTVPDAGDWGWLRSHRAGPMLEDLIAELAAELHDTGLLLWEGPGGRRLRSRILDRLPEGIGWLDVERMVAMVEGAGAGPVEDINGADDAELVVAEAKRRADAQRREATLNWLLAG